MYQKFGERLQLLIRIHPSSQILYNTLHTGVGLNIVRVYWIGNTKAYLMLIQVQDGEECVSVGLVAVYLHCRSEQWLSQNQIRDGRQIEQLSINIEELLE